MRLKNYFLFSLVFSKITCTFASLNHIIVELKNNGMNNIESSTGEIVMYQPDETIRLEVRVENETVWLTQQQIADLFQSSRTNVVEHVMHIYEDEELEESSTCRKFRQVRKEGKRIGNSDRFAKKAKERFHAWFLCITLI